MRKVLLLPTYFPTKYSEIIGSQVKEQSELLSEDVDFWVIHCLPGMGWLRFFLYLVLRCFTGKQFYKRCDSDLRPGKLKASGVYFFTRPWFPEQFNLWLRYSAYEYELNRIIASGWLPNLLHSRTAEYAGVHAAKLAKRFKLPNLLTENCLFLMDENLTIQKLKNYKFAIESAQKVSVVSNYLRTFLLTNNFNCNPILSWNCIDEDLFRIMDGLQDPSVFKVLNVGHTGFTKDWVTFFDAMSKVCFRFSPEIFRIIIAVTQVYDEESRAFIPLLIKRYNLESYCDVRFEVSRSEMPILYNEVNLFVTTSINETFGIASAEAMFCGIPVIATANGGISDFISEETGMLVPIKDVQSVANRVLDVINGQFKFDRSAVRASAQVKLGKAAFVSRMKGLYESM